MLAMLTSVKTAAAVDQDLKHSNRKVHTFFILFENKFFVKSEIINITYKQGTKTSGFGQLVAANEAI